MIGVWAFAVLAALAFAFAAAGCGDSGRVAELETQVAELEERLETAEAAAGATATGPPVRRSAGFGFTSMAATAALAAAVFFVAIRRWSSHFDAVHREKARRAAAP